MNNQNFTKYIHKFLLILLFPIFPILNGMEREPITITKKEETKFVITDVSELINKIEVFSKSAKEIVNLDAFTKKLVEGAHLFSSLQLLLKQPLSGNDRDRLFTAQDKLKKALQDIRARKDHLTDLIAEGWRGMAILPNEQHFRNAQLPESLINLIMQVYTNADELNESLRNLSPRASRVQKANIKEKINNLHDFISATIVLLSKELELSTDAQKSILKTTLNNFENLLKQTELANIWLTNRYERIR